MKSWLKLGSLAVTLSLLAACSSGLQTDTPNITEEPSLATQATTVSYRIPNSASDAEEGSVAYSYLPSTVLELGVKEEDGPQLTGLRFTGVNIPKGATITSAYIEFKAVTNASNSTSLKAYGIAESNTLDFSSGNSTISARPKTAAQVTWNPGSWTGGNTYNSASLISVVKEITNRSDWAAGKAMGFVVTGAMGTRKAASYDGNSTNAPKLVVTYNAPPPPSSASCLENVNRTVANPTKGETYFVRGKGTNAEIDARGKEFFVLKKGSARPMQIQNNGSGLCISGGKYSTLVKDDAIWEPDFHFGSAFYIDESPNLVMDNIAIDISGDGFSIHDDGRGTENWVVSDSYIRHSGDDAFEVDKMSGLIDDVLVDWTYQGVSCRNPDNTRTPGTITIQDSLFALKKQAGTYNNFKDGTYPKNPGHLHPFKLETENDRNCKLRLRNTVFYLTQNGGGNTVFWSRQEPTKYVLECKDVTLVYVGGVTYKDDGGRLAALRDRFGASCFKIQNQGESVDKKLAFWKAKRNEWFDRHTNNSQISYYRNREPQGVN